jgi:hypothetical protein
VTDNITLPRAVALQIRDVLLVWSRFALPADKAALAALDAALKEPGPTVKDSLRVASEDEVDAVLPRPAPSLAFLDGFRDGFRAAELFHGIKGSK